MTGVRPRMAKMEATNSTIASTIRPGRLLFTIPTISSTIPTASPATPRTRASTPGADVAARSVTCWAGSGGPAAPGAGVAVGFTSVAIRSTSTCQADMMYYHTDIYFIRQAYHRVAGA